ncbi:cytochrome c oxidase subunit III (mitochondrion) [Spodoptera frugiperda]|uniref:Cytochrome c oxidase subunit 3 n=1 Tax=Spodoptera frugiperda TaxID=7108 RepID=A0A0K0LG54_SPOFR|nr:cytochrome c oxidase subunit III [Spodoptera frugiperda]AJA05943.1 cytochrome c oxidase subunit III [Spodoptera frugiperda]
MKMNFNHPFHLVDYSPWPLTGAIGVMVLVSGMVKWFHNFNMNLLILGYFIVILTMYQWWRDICREGTYQGKHTILVTKGLRWGMILFIVSEIFFFVSFFWPFFHKKLPPNIESGAMWPPTNITPFNPFQIPLLNTIILISSGVSFTWAHRAIMKNNNSQMTQGLFITIILGIYFTILQAYEYFEAPFTIADKIWGSTFFMATGFRGLHVNIGTLLLKICQTRHLNTHFSSNHLFSLEAAAWYWHFVDVVWLFLYISIYWWGN